MNKISVKRWNEITPSEVDIMENINPWGIFLEDYFQRECNLEKAKNSIIVCLKNDDGLIGWSGFLHRNDMDKWSSIQPMNVSVVGVAVQKSFRGKGFGRILIGELMKEVTKSKYKLKKIKACSRQKNSFLYDIIREHGFRPVPIYK